MRLKLNGFAMSLCFALVCMLFTLTASAQKLVSGTVTSAKDNQPVPSVSVTVKGTNVATATAANGTFTINMPSGKNVLVFSSGGYEEREVTVGNDLNISVAMNVRVSELNEVVVTGYTAQRRKDITGAVSVVNTKDLKQMPVGTGEEAL